MENQQQQQLPVLKAHLGDDKRRFHLEDRSFAQLVLKVKSLYSLDHFTLKYRDCEGDLISFDTDQELDAALAQSCSRPLHLFVEPDRKEEDTSPKQFERLPRLQKKEEREKLREDKKFARQEQRGLRKEHHKCRRHDEKMQRKLARQQQKEERKRKSGKECGGCPNKHKKERLADVDFVDLDEEVFARFTHLFLDGNNMLFLTNMLRKLTLGHQTRKAEQVLQAFALKAAQRAADTPGNQLREVLLVFDETPTAVKFTVVGKTGQQIGFTVCSARPNFGSSDDALVSWEQQNPDTAGTSLFVTADRELCRRLQCLGAKLARPKHFLNFVCCDRFTETGERELDACVEQVAREMSCLVTLTNGNEQKPMEDVMMTSQ